MSLSELTLPAAGDHRALARAWLCERSTELPAVVLEQLLALVPSLVADSGYGEVKLSLSTAVDVVRIEIRSERKPIVQPESVALLDRLADSWGAISDLHRSLWLELRSGRHTPPIAASRKLSSKVPLEGVRGGLSTGGSTR